MSKLNLVLDLDNTLISSISINEMKRISNIKNRKLDFKVMEKYYNVYYRPHLKKFLDYAFKNFHITIWTAASRDYATFIIDNILMEPSHPNLSPKRQLKMFLYDDNCDQSQEFYDNRSPKDLRYLYNFEGYHPCNTIIMDDLPDVYDANPKQTLSAVYFDAKKKDSDKDDFLIYAISELEKIKHTFETSGCTKH